MYLWEPQTTNKCIKLEKKSAISSHPIGKGVNPPQGSDASLSSSSWRSASSQQAAATEKVCQEFFRNKFFHRSMSSGVHTVHHTRQSQNSEIKLVTGLFWFLCFKAENIFVNREDVNTKKCFKNLFNCWLFAIFVNFLHFSVFSGLKFPAGYTQQM